MRAAAKVAGVGVVTGMRSGVAALPEPTEHFLRNVSRPVSVIVSSSAQGVKTDESVQRPSWELDDWELAGGLEEETVVESAQPLPRLVFGGPPSLDEAKAATTDLKDAINTVYLSSPTHEGTDRSDLPLLSSTDPLETKGCITREFKAPVPKHAIMAFSLLNESPQVQNVVASIASDPDVWSAVLKNESLQEFLKSQKTDVSVEDIASTKKFTESSDDGIKDLSCKSEPLGIWTRITRIKVAVVDMVRNFSCQLKNYFVPTSTENSTVDAEEKSSSGFYDNMGTYIFGIAVMVILAIVVKRR